MSLKGRSFLTLKDFTSDEITYLLDLAADLKAKKKKGITGNSLKGKNIALIFEKPSTRTRCSFTIGCIDEGGHPEYLSNNEIQLGHKESVKDTARVLGRMFDGIEFRGFKQETVETLAEYSKVPVWNGLTDDFHPTQMLADIMTMFEEFGEVQGRKLVFLGDARNNVANSLMAMSSKMGVNYIACSPKELWPDDEFLKQVREIAAKTASLMPSVSLSVKIGVNTKDDSFLAKQGWQQSEIVPSMGYRNLYNGVHAASVGVTAHLGLKDTNAPEINLW